MLLTFEHKEESKKKERKSLPEIFLKLEGCLKHEGKFNYKEELTKALEEKYGL